MEVKDWNITDNSNTLLGSINLTEGVTMLDQGNDIARAIMGAVKRQLGVVGATSSNIASAATTNLATATGWYVPVTGTTTITSFGTVASGQMYVLLFSGALTLTYNATSMLLPGAANIVTAANDTAIMVSQGSGNWRCVAYQRASGVPIKVTSVATTDNAVVRFNGTGGVIQNSVVTIGDTGDIVTDGVIATTNDVFANTLLVNANTTTGTLTLTGSITGVTTLATSGNVTVGGALDMTSGAISNVTSLNGSGGALTIGNGSSAITVPGDFSAATVSGQFVNSTFDIGTESAVRVGSALAPSAGGSTARAVYLGSGTLGIFYGSGAPTLSAGKGSLYLRTDGTTTTNRMYVNTNGSTTWTAVDTVA
jgi:hypothetical protein